MALSTTRIFRSTKVTVIRQSSMNAHGGNGGKEPSFNSGNRSSLPGHFNPKEIAAGINWTEGSVGDDHVRALGIISCSCRKWSQDSSVYQPLAKTLYRAIMKDWTGRSAVSTQFVYFSSSSKQQRHRTTRDLVFTNVITIHNLAHIGISWYPLFSKCYIFMTTLPD